MDGNTTISANTKMIILSFGKSWTQDEVRKATEELRDQMNRSGLEQVALTSFQDCQVSVVGVIA